MLRREDEAEAALRLNGEPLVRFVLDVRRVVIQDDLDRRIAR